MKVYPSKISPGLAIFILLVLMGCSVPLLSPIIWSGLLINLVVLLFIIHLFATTFYKIEGKWLFIRSGFIVNRKLEIQSIKKITETNSLVSAPATSFDRLEISYDDHGQILISPKNKASFIAHLTKLNPKIEVQYNEKKP